MSGDGRDEDNVPGRPATDPKGSGGQETGRREPAGGTGREDGARAFSLGKSTSGKSPPARKTAKPTREDRLAEALRANLRRRKSAAKPSAPKDAGKDPGET